MHPRRRCDPGHRGAQTLANVHLALRENLTLIPVLNSIDLPSADPDTIIDELENVLSIPREEVILASAKDGTGVIDILEAIVERILAPADIPRLLSRVSIFDSHYDAYKGVIVYVRLEQGTLKDTSRSASWPAAWSRNPSSASSVRTVPVKQLTAGEVGYVATGLRTSARHRSATQSRRRHDRRTRRSPGTRRPRASFAGIYPVSGEDYPTLRDALDKLHLNDASFTFEPESSVALRGSGSAAGSRGLLHMESSRNGWSGVRSRTSSRCCRSSTTSSCNTAGAPSSSTTRPCRTHPTSIIEEPWVTPASCHPARISARSYRRGTFVNMEYLDPTRVAHFEMPLAAS